MPNIEINIGAKHRSGRVIDKVRGDVSAWGRGVTSNASRAGLAMRKFERDVTRSLTNVDRKLSKSQKTFKMFGLSAKSFLATLSAGVVARSFFAEFGRIESLQQTADKMGDTTKNIIAFQLAAKDTAGFLESTANMGLQRFTRRVAQAAEGTGEAIDVINELGLDANRLNFIGPIAAFDAVAGAIQNVRNQGDRLRIAQKLFDSEGAGLVNLLNAGQGTIARYADEVERLGLAFSKVEAAEIAKVNKQMLQLSRAFTGFKREIITAIGPATLGALETLTDFLEAQRKAATAPGGVVGGGRLGPVVAAAREEQRRRREEERRKAQENMKPFIDTKFVRDAMKQIERDVELMRENSIENLFHNVESPWSGQVERFIDRFSRRLPEEVFDPARWRRAARGLLGIQDEVANIFGPAGGQGDRSFFGLKAQAQQFFSFYQRKWRGVVKDARDEVQKRLNAPVPKLFATEGRMLSGGSNQDPVVTETKKQTAEMRKIARQERVERARQRARDEQWQRDMTLAFQQVTKIKLGRVN